jgi:hypothetical protein
LRWREKEGGKLMYDELVEDLRRMANTWLAEEYKVCAEAVRYLTREAADVIEELAAFKAQITDGHFYCMRDGVLYEAKVEMPKAKSIQLPPIEFAEEE